MDGLCEGNFTYDQSRRCQQYEVAVEGFLLGM